jgi:hypothetical protein
MIDTRENVAKVKKEKKGNNESINLGITQPHLQPSKYDACTHAPGP